MSMYLHILLRALTGGLDEYTYRNKRVNGGCAGTCILTWDGYQRAVETQTVLQNKVQGAVVEVGVFKGGISMFLQGILLENIAMTESCIW